MPQGPDRRRLPTAGRRIASRSPARTESFPATGRRGRSVFSQPCFLCRGSFDVCRPVLRAGSHGQVNFGPLTKACGRDIIGASQA
jgi:hypothetical protein